MSTDLFNFMDEIDEDEMNGYEDCSQKSQNDKEDLGMLSMQRMAEKNLIAEVHEKKKISGRLEDTKLTDNERQMYLKNFHSLLITAKEEIMKLKKKNLALEQKLEGYLSVQCPSCQHPFKAYENRILPNYIKILKGCNRIELNFSDFSKLEEFLNISNLDSDKNKIPTLPPNDNKAKTLRAVDSVLIKNNFVPKKDVVNENGKRTKPVDEIKEKKSEVRRENNRDQMNNGRDPQNQKRDQRNNNRDERSQRNPERERSKHIGDYRERSESIANSSYCSKRGRYDDQENQRKQNNHRDSKIEDTRNRERRGNNNEKRMIKSDDSQMRKTIEAPLRKDNDDRPRITVNEDQRKREDRDRNDKGGRQNGHDDRDRRRGNVGSVRDDRSSRKKSIDDDRDKGRDGRRRR